MLFAMNLCRICVFFPIALALASIAGAQQAPTSPATARPRPARVANAGSVSGTVKDGTGGVIPGAKLTLSNESGTVQTATSGADGNYTFRNVPPGTYTVSSSFTGLQQEGVTAVIVEPGAASTSNIVMTIQVQKQEVTVTDTTVNTVSTDPANNATALVLRQEDLDALPDDPDDLASDLQALAGPGAGPGGSQIFIDGFTGGRLPPKESIREVRINSNPFSAEFDKVGFGRIQIFTKPGSDKFHGQGFYSISDKVWNSRNPFSNVNPPFRSQNFGGNVSGPLGKHASFFVDTERRHIDDNGIIVATIPTPDFTQALQYSTFGSNYFPTPQRRTTVSPRVDYQLNANNTLSFRYSYLENNRAVTGIGGFNLPTTTIGNVNFASSGYGLSTTEHGVQIVETAVLSPKAINESRFQFDHEISTWTSQSATPTVAVGQAFTAGGSGYSAPGYGSAYDLENAYEFQNYTSLTQGPHTMKFGIRIRTSVLDNSTPRGYNGTYQFLGGIFPLLDSGLNAVPGQTTTLRSIDQYLLTEQLFQAGRTSAQIQALGYGPSKYLVSTGNPYLGFYQMDFGPFFQDDWKVRPNLTLSMGLRWESQTNIPSKNSWAPRFAVAWSPDNRGGNGRPKTVIRAGWGLFYDRFAATNVQTAYRYASALQQSYQIAAPSNFDFNSSFNTQVPFSQLTAVATSSQRYQIDSTLQAPRLMQTALTVERQLFNRTSLSFNFTNTRGTHQLRTAAINSPIVPIGALPPGAPGGAIGVRPYGNIGDIYNYQSDGIYKQTQIALGFNSQIGKRGSLFTRYSYTDANSNTDGLGTVISNPYNWNADWGQSSLNFRHNLFVGGSVSAPWGLRLSPFLVAHSGQPFNIITGTDLYQQGLANPSARPALLGDNLDLSNRNTYLRIPAAGAAIIPRNYVTGGGFIGLNMRLSKTFGFGPTKFSGPSGGSRSGGGGGPGPGGGGGRRGSGGFGGGPPGGFGESSNHRYNLTVSINARNVINHQNPNTFNGSLTSPYFFQPTNITGGFGAEATASNQRRIDLQLRFAF